MFWAEAIDSSLKNHKGLYLLHHQICEAKTDEDNFKGFRCRMGLNDFTVTQTALRCEFVSVVRGTNMYGYVTVHVQVVIGRHLSTLKEIRSSAKGTRNSEHSVLRRGFLLQNHEKLDFILQPKPSWSCTDGEPFTGGGRCQRRLWAEPFDTGPLEAKGVILASHSETGHSKDLHQ